ASGPLQRSAGALYAAARITFGKSSVIVRGDRAFELVTKGCRRKQFCFSNRFGGETSGCGQWISRTQLDAAHRLVAPANGRDYIRADVSDRSITHAIDRVKDHARLRLTAEFIVAETQMRLRVIIDLDDEVIIEAAAPEQVMPRMPTPVL